MPPGVVGRLVRATGLAVSFVAIASARVEAAPAAGVVITNTVTANYVDEKGTAYGAESNAVKVTVATVAAIAVSPKQTAADATADGYPAGSAVVRTFTIANTGNAPDAYVLSSVTASAGTVTGVAFLEPRGAVPVTVGTTVTPALAPGASIRVQVTLATANVPVGTALHVDLVARSSDGNAANGFVSDSGRTWAMAQALASLAGPGGPNTVVSKLVGQQRTVASAPGTTITYSIAFKNYGGSPATNVVLTDDVPPGIVALPRTTALNGVNVAASATLSGQRLVVRVGTMPPGASDTVTFDALVQKIATAGSSFVNVASVSADGIAPVSTAPASVLVGVANIVFDGYSGGALPIGGATMTIRDPNTHAVVALPSGSSLSTMLGSSSRMPFDAGGAVSGLLPPNTTNSNPYTTGPDGTYSFAFASSQLGTLAHPAKYELDIDASGYVGRRVLLTINPDASGLLYDATLTSLDGQMLAAAGGFTLTANSVTLSEVFGLLGNFPMFTPHPIALSKTVDRDTASGGDRLLYTVQVGSNGGQFGTTRIIDTLPAGVVYAPGSARVDGSPLEPVRSGRILTWTFSSLSAQHTIAYACVVMPFASEGSTLVNVVDADALATSGFRAHASATADTRVVAGTLGNRIVITGRVFADARRTGRFRDGDAGIGDVRIYLEDGESVVTDKYGRFTFPSVHPGQHVLRLDASTLPPTVRPYADHRFDSTRSLQRLLHGIYDAGLMQDVEFALEPAA